MSLIKIDRFALVPLASDPFEHVVTDGFLDTDTVARVNETFPVFYGGGSFPAESLPENSVMRQVITELDSEAFETAVSEKFGIELKGSPKMYSLRGYTREKDGRIHTDSVDKIITVLLYLNRDWTIPAGRLRLLRDGRNLENYAVEVAPVGGALLAFKRSDCSWHGHHPYVGQRRALQMNWMTGERARGFHAIRHKISSMLKGSMREKM